MVGAQAEGLLPAVVIPTLSILAEVLRHHVAHHRPTPRSAAAHAAAAPMAVDHAAVAVAAVTSVAVRAAVAAVAVTSEVAGKRYVMS